MESSTILAGSLQGGWWWTYQQAKKRRESLQPWSTGGAGRRGEERGASQKLGLWCRLSTGASPGPFGEVRGFWCHLLSSQRHTAATCRSLKRIEQGWTRRRNSPRQLNMSALDHIRQYHVRTLHTHEGRLFCTTFSVTLGAGLHVWKQHSKY